MRDAYDIQENQEESPNLWFAKPAHGFIGSKTA
jgi:hypothetical protein